MAVFCRLKGGGKLELGTDNMATQRYMWGVTNTLAIVHLIMGSVKLEVKLLWTYQKGNFFDIFHILIYYDLI